MQAKTPMPVYRNLLKRSHPADRQQPPSLPPLAQETRAAFDRTADNDPPAYLPLDRETRAGVETDCAAFHLNRRPQTLRCWAAFETGPLRPLRVHGRLMWPTADLRKLCGVE